MAIAKFTEDQFNTLNAAIAQGVLEVKYADKTVIYRSLKEMLTLRTLMKEELGIKRSGRKYAKFNKGLGYETSTSTTTGA